MKLKHVSAMPQVKVDSSRHYQLIFVSSVSLTDEKVAFDGINKNKIGHQQSTSFVSGTHWWKFQFGPLVFHLFFCGSEWPWFFNNQRNVSVNHYYLFSMFVLYSRRLWIENCFFCFCPKLPYTKWNKMKSLHWITNQYYDHKDKC